MDPLLYIVFQLDLLKEPWDPEKIPFTLRHIGHINTPLWFDALSYFKDLKRRDVQEYLALACSMELDSCVFLWDSGEEEVRVIPCDEFLSVSEILAFQV